MEYAQARKLVDATASDNILRTTYVWINRLLWPVAAIVSGLTTYWTFALPHPPLLVEAGGCVFGLFGAICVLNTLLWWDRDRDGSV